MSKNIIYAFLFASIGICAIIFIAYFILLKKMDSNENNAIKKLRQGTKTTKLSMEVLYMKLYSIYTKIPVIKRYILKLRRRLEIINIEDEYKTRKQSAMALTRALLWILPLSIIIIIVAHSNIILLVALFLFEVFIIEALIEGNVNKLDNKLLKQQVDFFGEIRHTYHETNMIEEAIYQVSQTNEQEVSLQGEKIYNILISDDPEIELEKYYDIAPNLYLKEFAGLSYLTREFGDRKTETGSSVYLNNLNNITKEMQLEILKRDKLDYVFQSLSVISIIPVLLIEPLKAWAISNFTFVQGFYNGKIGTIITIILLLITIVCYILIRKVKDTTIKNVHDESENPFQEKLYKNPIIKRTVNAFMPKKRTKEYVKITRLLKNSASHLKIEWLYVNKLLTALIVLVVSLLMFKYIHSVASKWVYEEIVLEDGTSSMMMSNSEQKTGKKILEIDNELLKKLMKMSNVTKNVIKNQLELTEYYKEANEDTINEATNRVYNKYNVLLANSQIQWYEVLLSIGFCCLGYMIPNLFMYFQYKMRQLEMEDEVMQFQTIIRILMKIERVNVEMILEWMERYADIFKEPISRCVLNYESGAWEALEELKNEITYPQFVSIVECLQAAVEKIPIRQAFDELETEREYYQEKRKETNERLISRKGLIGKVIGFAPMIILFVGYLIAPMMVMGIMNMSDSMSTMQSMM
jgi:hypothetical protein